MPTLRQRTEGKPKDFTVVSLEKRVALSSARLEECSEYLKWLEMIGRETPENWQKSWIYPQETWIGPKNTPRESPDWKPFNSSLAYTSRKAASTIVRRSFRSFIRPVI